MTDTLCTSLWVKHSHDTPTAGYYLMDHALITESQTHLGWKRPLKSLGPTINHLAESIKSNTINLNYLQHMSK